MSDDNVKTMLVIALLFSLVVFIGIASAAGYGYGLAAWPVSFVWFIKQMESSK
jgi:hypothetical protein